MTDTIVINSEYFGQGDNQLGEKLMGSFLRKIWSFDKKPKKIIFYNSGVKLLAQGSPVLDALDGLHSAGVDLIACGTCATHYNIKDKIVIGRISDMHEIASSLINDEKIITL